MAPSHSSADSSEGDEPQYPHALASSLAGLPVRVAGGGLTSAAAAQESAEDATAGSRAKSGQLKDFLDLAVSLGRICWRGESPRASCGCEPTE